MEQDKVNTPAIPEALKRETLMNEHAEDVIQALENECIDLKNKNETLELTCAKLREELKREFAVRKAKEVEADTLETVLDKLIDKLGD